MGRKLFVSRLSFYATQEQLKKLFAPFGEVASVNLVVDPKTKRTKGYGFVSYNTQIEAEKALKAMNGRIVDGRLLLVEPAGEK
ncbi:cold-inducible RNA-binding protein-like [Vigna unguiculata]|uniref:Cold-inducible RNA-binding protein n=1 Tax=Vigna unguiculata TaxID=3917 RepID=A0A4D6N8T8_VIGUN|nr:cold-inducible RNA-binding protein-like [Vigna unguiculata]QCE09251.1 cold-inducible RNA-binding protein [Vigna unguiculata]